MEDFRENIIPHQHSISKEDRVSRISYNPGVIWFTGLSGSGKSTLASALEQHLHTNGYQTIILDGDNIRKGLNADLDFSDESRKENIRRISEVAKLLNDAGVLVLTAFISPFREDRENACKIIGKENYIEVFVDCPIDICEERDVKGLYQKARQGKIKDFTGIDSPFEEPLQPHIKLNTAQQPFTACLQLLIDEVEAIIKK